jgi:hypothetical protein
VTTLGTSWLPPSGFLENNTNLKKERKKERKKEKEIAYVTGVPNYITKN